MARDWNGLSLVDEFSSALSDTSSTFETRVLAWINETMKDICARHDWNFTRVKGKKVLVADSEEQSIIIDKPGAATLAPLAGGSLVDGTVYTVYITYYESVSGIETEAGTASATITPSGANLSITVSAIPVSPEPLVTSRKIYLQAGSAEPFYYSTISDNTTLTATITAPTSSTQTPPDESYIRKLYGNPFFESGPSRQLTFQPIDQIRRYDEGAIGSGSPSVWAPLQRDRLLLDSKPSSALTLSFYFYKIPAEVFNESTSIPDIPKWLKPILRAGVISLGYEYRDRDGQESKRANYETILTSSISRMGSPVKVPRRIRDVNGNSDGFIIG